MLFRKDVQKEGPRDEDEETIDYWRRQSGLWMRLENRYYRRQIVYQSIPLSESVRGGRALPSSLVFASQFGGVIGLIGDRGWGLQFPLQVFSGSGRLLASVPLSALLSSDSSKRSASRVLAAAWVDTSVSLAHGSVCMAVAEDGTLTLTAIGKDRWASVWKGNILREQDIRAELLVDAVFFGSGNGEGHFLVGRTSSGGFVVVSHVESSSQLYRAARPRATMCILEDSKPVVVVPPRQGLGGQDRTTIQARVLPNGKIEVFAIDYRERIWKVNGATGQSQCVDAMFNTLSMSPKFDLLAAVSQDGAAAISVFATETMRPVLQLSLRSHGQPDSVAWCGNDALCVASGRQITLIGPRSGTVSVEATDCFVMWSESDGLRVLSTKDVWWIDVIPASTEHTLGPSGTEPPHQMFESYLKSMGPARGAMDFRSSILDRHLLLRKFEQEGTLRSATEELLECSRAQWIAGAQKRLLECSRRAMDFAHGRSQNGIDDYDSRIPETCALLRVLNAVRDETVGMPVTLSQLTHLGPEGLVQRLGGLGLHSLGLQLANFMGIRVNYPLEAWAVDLIEDSGRPSVTETIITQFAKQKRLFSMLPPFAEVAKEAVSLGHAQAAHELLRLETRGSQKVHVLNSLNETLAALKAAAKSYDTEVLTLSLLRIMKKRKLIDVIRTLKTEISVNDISRVVNVLSSTLRQLGRWKDVKQVLLELGRPQEAANVDIHMIGIAGSVGRSEKLDRVAMEMMRTTSARRALLMFEENSIRRAARTAALGSRLEKKLGLPSGSLVRASESELLTVTVVKLPNSPERKEELARIRRELQIPDRRFSWMCLTAMSSLDDFQGLASLCSKDEPPIGFGPFAEACLSRKNVPEAIRYAHRITDQREKARMLARCGLGREAAEIASRLNNQALMEEVASLAANSFISNPT